MNFLMGLNENFAQVRGQLLLMDPLPPINKVFSLISQEERQRRIGSQLSSTTELAFAVKFDTSKKFTSPNNNTSNYKGPKRDRPYCIHCNYPRNTIEKCFKLHGYPPGFRQK